MQRFLDWCAHHPWTVIVLVLFASGLAATRLDTIRVQVTADELLVQDDPERDYYEEVRKRFGDDNVALLYLEDPTPFAPGKLKKLAAVIERLKALPFVSRVESLFSVPYLKTVDGYLNKDPYFATLPESPEAADRIRDAALKNSFIRQVLLSREGRVLAAAIVLDPKLKGGDDERVVHALREAAAPLAGVYETRFTIGYPQIRVEIADRIRSEKWNLAPAALIALIAALFVLLRRFVDILTPVLTAAISILWTLGVMGLFGIPLNVVTSIVPILLIVVGSTQDIHLLSEFRQGQRQGLCKADALGHMSRKMGRTVFLTFLTTFIGFLSVGLSHIEVLWQFGIAAAIGLALNFLVTVTLIPAILALAGGEGLRGATASDRDLKRAERYWRWLHSHRRKIYVVVAAAVAAAASGIPAIEVNHNPVESLGAHSEMRDRVDQVNRRLSGLETFSIVVDSGIEDTFLKVRYLEELVKLQQFVAAQGLARSSTSFADYIELLNAAFQELDEPAMPASDDVVAELMIFLDYNRVKGYVSEDYSSARILVRHNVSSSHELARFVKELQSYIDTRLDPGLDARITGDSVLTLSATGAMIFGQMQSILLLLALFVLLIAVLFADPRVGLLAAVPNAIPVIVLFGFMGYAGIPLNIGTTMAAAIAIGIAVDDTMHFMLRYNQELKSAKGQDCAMYLTIRGETRPIVATSLALIAGFLVFALSDFEPIRQFGMLSALVMGTALLCDLMVTPLVIASLRLVTLWDLMSLEVRRDVVAGSPLFNGMRDWQIRRFILSSTLMELERGQLVFQMEDASDELYLVMEGRIEVRVPREKGVGEGFVVDSFGVGAIFGEVALLAGESRRGNAVALEPSKVLVLTREGIANAILRHPLIAARFSLNLATDISRRWVRFIARARKSQISGPSPAAEEEVDERQKDGRADQLP